MIILKKASRYQRQRDKFVKNNSRREKALIKTLDRFVSAPFHPSLKLEKLEGSDVWSIRIDRENRLFFIWIDKRTALLIDIGPHDKYRKY